ncbi:MAG TPA: DUF5663 domain-containing protein [Candidatus Saccharimonadales bacterium]|nr:DUF5663 domain-containing protein [Candidatus Saccharimonadales bacterium]
MLKIDNSLLVEVGLGNLPAAEKNSFLKHIYETLEMRVGIRLADQMTNEQLDEFERYFEAKDDAGAFKWLETNFPNYKEIVQQEFDKLKAEVAQSAPQILAASQQAGAQAPQAVPAAQPGVPVPQTQPAPVPQQQPVAIPDPSLQQPYAPAPQQQPAPSAPHHSHHQQQYPHHAQHQTHHHQQQSAQVEPPFPPQQPPAGPAAPQQQ